MAVAAEGPIVVDPDSPALFELPEAGPVRAVLVVDDDHDIRELVAQKLSRAGFRVVTAPDGAAALAAVEADTFDLILLDVAMPGLSGIDVCRFLRDDPRTAEVPVVMLTARTHATFATLGYMAGADMYLSKPFSPRELVEQVRGLLERPPEAATPAGPADPAPEPVAATEPPPDGRRSRWLRRG
jgi:DNA-binding response OmpR family regulator